MPSTAGEAAQLAALGKRLKAASRGDLRRKLLRNIREAAKPLATEAQKSALATLPHRGGLAAEVASSPVVVRTSLSSAYARVRLRDASPHRTARFDAGVVRHPTFGHDPYTNQQIPPGWWTRPMEAGAPHVRAAVVRAVNEVARELTD